MYVRRDNQSMRGVSTDHRRIRNMSSRLGDSKCCENHCLDSFFGSEQKNDVLRHLPVAHT